MPQMAPISWLSLFFIFSITLMIFCTLNYFSFIPIKTNSVLNKNNLNNTNSLNWKW